MSLRRIVAPTDSSFFPEEHKLSEKAFLPDLLQDLLPLSQLRCSFPRIIITVARPAIVLRHGRHPRLDHVSNECNGPLRPDTHRRPRITRSRPRNSGPSRPWRRLNRWVYIPSTWRITRRTFRCPKTKMIVVPHERIGEDFNSPQPKSFGHRVKERLTVPVVRKRRLPCGAAIHDVVERPGY